MHGKSGRVAISSALLLWAFLGIARSQGLPPGYSWSTFFVESGGAPPTSLAVDPAGRLYMGTLAGTIRVLQDLDSNRAAETVTTFWSGSGINPPLLGLLHFQGSLFVSHLGTISRIDDTNSDLVGDVKTDLVTGLPNGWHQNNGLFTDGTWIYFGLGTQTDHDVEPDPRSGTLMRMMPDGTSQQIFASGLRNVFDGVIHPASGHVIVADNGPNLVPGNPDPPDEVNLVVQGANYGHPNYWGQPPPGTGTVAPLADIYSHFAPTGMATNPVTSLSGYRHEIWTGLFGGPVTGLARVMVTYHVVTGAPHVDIEYVCIAGAGFTCSLPVQAVIDVIFSPAGELFVCDYVAGKVFMIYQTRTARIRIDESGAVGTLCPITLSDPAYPNHFVFAAASDYALTSPLVLAPGISLDLDLTHPIFSLSILPQNGVFYFPQPGLLDAQGEFVAAIAVPNVPALIGMAIRLQYVVFDPQTFQFVDISPPQGFWIRP